MSKREGTVMFIVWTRTPDEWGYYQGGGLFRVEESIALAAVKWLSAIDDSDLVLLTPEILNVRDFHGEEFDLYFTSKTRERANSTKNKVTFKLAMTPNALVEYYMGVVGALHFGDVRAIVHEARQWILAEELILTPERQLITKGTQWNEAHYKVRCPRSRARRDRKNKRRADQVREVMNVIPA